MMELAQLAKAFKELGHASRLAIYKEVIRAGHQGIAVGQLHTKLKIPNSTLSHHISGLVAANLIVQRREGRTLFCVAQYEQRTQVIDFLQAECCINEIKPYPQ